MYPALILIIVNKERSIVETFGFSTVLGGNLTHEGHATAEHRPATIGNLVFANPPTDNEWSLSTRHSTVPGDLRRGELQAWI
jgi:hypothetical protein